MHPGFCLAIAVLLSSPMEKQRPDRGILVLHSGITPVPRGALARMITVPCAAVVARPVQAHRWTRYGGGGGVSTVGAAATRLARWLRRRHTRAPRQWRHSGGRQQWVGGPAAPVTHGEGKERVQST
jgi:hypothetical protein